MISEVIPQDYIVEKFFQYAGYPKYKKITDIPEEEWPAFWGPKPKPKKGNFFVNKDAYDNIND